MVPRQPWLCRCGNDVPTAIPLRIGPTRDGTEEVLNMLKVSAVPPRRSAVLTVFPGDYRRSMMSEPLWNHGDHGGANAVYAVQAPHCGTALPV